MKRLLPLLLALALVFVAACGDDDDGNDVAEGDTSEDTMPPTTEPEPAPSAVCDSYLAWEESGDVAELVSIKDHAEEIERVDITGAIDQIVNLQDDATQQDAYDGAVTYLRGALVDAGCELG